MELLPREVICEILSHVRRRDDLLALLSSTATLRYDSLSCLSQISLNLEDTLPASLVLSLPFVRIESPILVTSRENIRELSSRIRGTLNIRSTNLPFRSDEMVLVRSILYPQSSLRMENIGGRRELILWNPSAQELEINSLPFTENLRRILEGLPTRSLIFLTPRGSNFSGEILGNLSLERLSLSVSGYSLFPEYLRARQERELPVVLQSLRFIEDNSLSPPYDAQLVGQLRSNEVEPVESVTEIIGFRIFTMRWFEELVSYFPNLHHVVLMGNSDDFELVKPERFPQIVFETIS